MKLIKRSKMEVYSNKQDKIELVYILDGSVFIYLCNVYVHPETYSVNTHADCFLYTCERSVSNSKWCTIWVLVDLGCFLICADMKMQKKMFVLRDNYSFPCKVYCFSALMSFYIIKFIVYLWNIVSLLHIIASKLWLHNLRDHCRICF